MPADDENNHENNFFSVDNIKKIFLDFAKHREQLENPKLRERTANEKIELYDSGQNLTVDKKIDLAKDAIKDCYKMLAIFCFSGVLSAKDLGNNLKKLQSIEQNLDENVINPGWFETFCLVVLSFYLSFLECMEKRKNIETLSFQEAKNVVSALEGKNVFKKLKQTAQTLHKDNARE